VGYKKCCLYNCVASRQLPGNCRQGRGSLESFKLQQEALCMQAPASWQHSRPAV
jgi:hypothetical protein